MYESAGQIHPSCKSFGITGFPALNPETAILQPVLLSQSFSFTCLYYLWVKGSKYRPCLQSPPGKGMGHRLLPSSWAHAPLLWEASYFLAILPAKGAELRGKGRNKGFSLSSAIACLWLANKGAYKEMLTPSTQWLLGPSSSCKLSWRYYLPDATTSSRKKKQKLSYL